MFKKVYKSKEVMDIRDNEFRLTEVTRNRSFRPATHHSQTDIEEFIDEQDNFVRDDFEEEEDFYPSAGGHEDEMDDFMQADNYSSCEEDSCHQDFASYDFASTDWNSVDAASVNWADY